MSGKEIFSEGIIREIVSASNLGAHDDQMIAIIEHPWHGQTANAWINVPEEGSFKIGDEVILFETHPEPNLTVWGFELIAKGQ